MIWRLMWKQSWSGFSQEKSLSCTHPHSPLQPASLVSSLNQMTVHIETYYSYSQFLANCLEQCSPTHFFFYFIALKEKGNYCPVRWLSGGGCLAARERQLQALRPPNGERLGASAAHLWHGGWEVLSQDCSATCVLTGSLLCGCC